MNENHPSENQVIQIEESLIGFEKPPPRRVSVNPKKIGDYPGVPSVYLEVAKLYANPLSMGPPICDELVALVQHMFTEEEASLVRHIRSLKGKTAKAVAAAAHRPAEEVRPILDRLACEKFILLSIDEEDKEKKYGLMPILPGVFELVMLQTSQDALTEWHRRFAELFAALYETGYLAEYFKYPAGMVRYVPVGETIETCQTALPVDRLEEVLDKYEVFAVGLCDCRITERIVGRGCDKPLENCVAFGNMAEFVIQHDKMRRAEKKEILEIKAEAAASGLASFIAEVELGGTTGGASCSCCGCCCAGLRTISQFNTPGMFAPPHFMPQVELARCTYCGKCARVCPVGAMVVDAKGKSHQHRPERCIGCGLCAVACDKQRAIQMEPVPKHIKLSEGKLPAIVRTANYLRNAWSVWRKYR